MKLLLLLVLLFNSLSAVAQDVDELVLMTNRGTRCAALFTLAAMSSKLAGEDPAKEHCRAEIALEAAMRFGNLIGLTEQIVGNKYDRNMYFLSTIVDDPERIDRISNNYGPICWEYTDDAIVEADIHCQIHEEEPTNALH